MTHHTTAWLLVGACLFVSASARAQDDETCQGVLLDERSMVVSETDGADLLVHDQSTLWRSTDAGSSFVRLDVPAGTVGNAGFASDGTPFVELVSADDSRVLLRYTEGFWAEVQLPEEGNGTVELVRVDGDWYWIGHLNGTPAVCGPGDAERWECFSSAESFDGPRVFDDGTFATAVWNGICGGYNDRRHGEIGPDPYYAPYPEFVFDHWTEVADGWGVGWRSDEQALVALHMDGTSRTLIAVEHRPESAVRIGDAVLFEIAGEIVSVRVTDRRVTTGTVWTYNDDSLRMAGAGPGYLYFVAEDGSVAVSDGGTPVHVTACLP